MRIGIDARCLNTYHVRGMGRVVFALLKHASNIPDVEFVLFSNEPNLPLHCPVSPRITSYVWEMYGDRLRTWEQTALPREAARKNCDLLHATCTWAPWWQPVPSIVTIHDTIPWDRDGDEHHSRFFLDVLQPSAYRRARLLTTPSRNSFRDIVNHWPELESRLQVVPWGIDEVFTADVTPNPGDYMLSAAIRSPYLLYLGGHIARKRLMWAIEAWIGGTSPGVQLVACGLPTDQFDQWRSRVKDSRRQDFIPLPFVPDCVLPALYAHAIAIMYPTEYEGFGFPVLEAQAMGRPILFSPLGSLSELIGPSAVLLPHNELQPWISTVRSLCSAPPSNNGDAIRWARKFSWARVADQVLTLYRQVLENKN